MASSSGTVPKPLGTKASSFGANRPVKSSAMPAQQCTPPTENGPVYVEEFELLSASKTSSTSSANGIETSTPTRSMSFGSGHDPVRPSRGGSGGRASTSTPVLSEEDEHLLTGVFRERASMSPSEATHVYVFLFFFLLVILECSPSSCTHATHGD